MISPTVAVSIASAAASAPVVGSGAPGSANCTIRPPTCGSNAHGTDHDEIPSPVATASHTTSAGTGSGTVHSTRGPPSPDEVAAVTWYMSTPAAPSSNTRTTLPAGAGDLPRGCRGGGRGLG